MKKVLLLGISVVSLLALAGCQSTDVVGKVAVTSFNVLLEKQGSAVSFDEGNGGWSMTSPKGEAFLWSKDFSQAGKPDLMMAFDAKPFIEAGLDPSKLDSEMYLYDSGMNQLMLHSELGEEAFTYKGEATPLASFEQLVKTHRDNIGYHEVLDHYGVAFGEGNMVEWAKDMATNDKDLVFVLNPEAFIKAGVDPSKVKEWVFTQVEVKNEKGEFVKVDKFLKPYNLD